MLQSKLIMKIQAARYYECGQFVSLIWLEKPIGSHLSICRWREPRVGVEHSVWSLNKNK